MTIDWKVHTYASLPSTQDYVKELAAEGLAEGIVVQCLEQRRGRGRQGRHWHSPLGNLYMSVLLRPHCPVDRAGQISFVAALALSRAIDHILGEGHDKKLKWPNDVLIDGQKAAGILLESDTAETGEIASLALGIGVNILAAPPDENAVALQDVSGDTQVIIHPFRDMVLKELAQVYQDWIENGFEPVRKAWLAETYDRGSDLTVKIDGKTTAGKFEGIDKAGYLLLKTDDHSTETVSTGDVYFATDNA